MSFCIAKLIGFSKFVDTKLDISVINDGFDRSNADIENIQAMNNPQAVMVKKQRENTINQQGEVKEAGLLDKKLGLNKQSADKFKNTLKNTNK